MSKPIEHVVVVGGGSAGWLTAAVLAAEHPRLAVTLVESPGVAPIGVGEGTWPSMRETLQRIGVSEAAFFRECDAAFKQGSRFDRWVDGSDGDAYFHPFSLPQGYGEANLAAAWQRAQRGAHHGISFAELVSYQPHLCRQGRAPKQPQTPEYAGVANYGYHLDAGKFGVFLQKHCTGKLRVRHVLAHVVDIIAHENGDIAALRTHEAGVVEGDLFVDCTGMAALLLGRHYGVPFVSQRDVLFNDRALAVQVAYPAPDTPIGSQTTSTAQACGWIWDIGLPTRRGVGHVYSSAHCSDDEAESALRAYLAATGIAGDGLENVAAPRKIVFDPGYRARFWERNVVAIGLSAGFIEPLEASALALVELSAAWLADDLPATRAHMDTIAARFNDAFTYRWERIIDFLKLHYALSKRADSAYWTDHRAPGTQSPRLRDLLALWRTRAPAWRDFPRIEEIFPSASWQYILYGMGFRPEFPERASDLPARADQYFREAARLAARMLPQLPANREMLEHIRQYGMPAS